MNQETELTSGGPSSFGGRISPPCVGFPRFLLRKRARSARGKKLFCYKPFGTQKTFCAETLALLSRALYSALTELAEQDPESRRSPLF